MEPENEKVLKVIKKAEYVQRICSRSGREITAEKSSLYKLLQIIWTQSREIHKIMCGLSSISRSEFTENS